MYIKNCILHIRHDQWGPRIPWCHIRCLQHTYRMLLELWPCKMSRHVLFCCTGYWIIYLHVCFQSQLEIVLSNYWHCAVPVIHSAARLYGFYWPDVVFHRNYYHLSEPYTVIQSAVCVLVTNWVRTSPLLQEFARVVWLHQTPLWLVWIGF